MSGPGSASDGDVGPAPAFPSGAGLPVAGPPAGSATPSRQAPEPLAAPPRPAIPSPHQALLDLAEPLLAAADPGVAAAARGLAIGFARGGQASPGVFMEFGAAVQMEVAALADALVTLARQGDAAEITARMGRIAAVVRELRPDALLAPRPKGWLERLVEAAMERESPEAAMRAVDVEAAMLRSHLPALRDALAAIEAAIAEDARLRDALEAHILACEILLAEARAAQPANPRAIEALEDRHVALRRSRLINQTDAAQLEMMERTTRRLVEQVTSVVTDLVGAWKRHCAAALAVGNAAAPGAAAASLAAARARLLDAIAAAR